MNSDARIGEAGWVNIWRSGQLTGAIKVVTTQSHPSSLSIDPPADGVLDSGNGSLHHGQR